MKIINNKAVYIDVVAKIIYAVIFLSIIILGIWFYESEAFDQVRPIEGDGKYLIHPTASIPRNSPNMFIVEDDKIFLFYIEEELINVYTISGDYLYGLQFPDGQNGKSDMCYENGLLYVDARGSGIYVFEDTELLRFELQHYQNEEHTKLGKIFNDVEDHRDGEYVYLYVEDANRIIRSNYEGAETVLQFPERIFDPLSFTMLVLLMLILWEFIWGKKQNNT